MSTRPILFSAPMVKAILAGRKTQTRRVVVQPKRWHGRFDIATDEVIGPEEIWWWNGVHDRTGASQPCPYGKAGDALVVRETWQYGGFTEDGYPFIGYRADGARELKERYPEEWAERLEDIWAALSSDENYSIDSRAADRRWRPAIHMPHWASRIALSVTGVRAERIQQISAADSLAEGIDHHTMNDPRVEFQWLWDSINGKRAPWDSNPWVWVVQFARA